ncbi:hypothetical protein B566_EDAN007311 [Ephemera danica]|nr:hypothetical protein B566_EDAN007311 [Ephemera danica]
MKGPSSVEGYIRALGNGLDCWDGPDQPMVFHAGILKRVLREVLYVHRNTSPKDPSQISPRELRGRVLIMGKKLPADCKDDHGEVTDEDEGSETSKRKEKQKKISICKELSDLVSLVRSKFIDFSTSRQIQTTREMCSLSESTAAKLAHACAEDFVNHNKTFLTRVYPNASRIDSSNYNPQDFWNCGCQLVALNFQTPGQMMDLYDGRFRQNGGCGYVLKPSVMREQISFFSANARDLIPGVSPQILHLKIISGQHLPRPRGSTAKGEVIDPYIVVQLFGIPADCTERKTKTVSNEGNCPIFEESFEFQVVLPELVLVRFVVLDDEYIGDDFIGQYTIPFDCLQTGYRHIRLLSNTGEPLENSSIFVHVAITNKKGGGKPQNKRYKSEKLHTDIRTVGLKQVDDVLKARQDVEAAMDELRAECGLNEAANMKQCLRVLLQRISASPQVSSIIIIEENERLPTLKVDATTLPAHLHKGISTFDKAIIEIQFMVENGDRLVHSSASTIGNYTNKDRSPSTLRTQRKMNLFCKRPSADTIQTLGPQTRSPTSPAPLSPANDIKPKSILKKSNSNIEQSSLG